MISQLSKTSSALPTDANSTPPAALAHGVAADPQKNIQADLSGPCGVKLSLSRASHLAGALSPTLTTPRQHVGGDATLADTAMGRRIQELRTRLDATDRPDEIDIALKEVRDLDDALDLLLVQWDKNIEVMAAAADYMKTFELHEAPSLQPNLKSRRDMAILHAELKQLREKEEGRAASTSGPRSG